MTLKVYMLIVIILGILEIFFSVFTLLVESIMRVFNKNFKLSEKAKGIIKLFFVALFMISVIYFIAQTVKVLANIFGISLDKSILDIFR
ncbi:hypothetical protein CLPU_4c02330 [Gottschalkia purinilytica]|uniref:Uncharacterized protein n=1 Tax=Gottschalkia purinilytica TaxID=1503 RepID=A0A0L0WCJ5_GOTPU|nr:hypothetical protein [Gottschalkia purinilytica]KNF09187.1 hypothetical protein CLPU_4c02330 [Gottschalkia purinilytica]